MRRYLGSLDPRLPRPVWILSLGGLANAFGNGLAYPFLVIYLHNVRGISLGTAGLVLATIGAVSLLAGPAVGVVIDRIGGRATLAVALVLLAIGFGSFPLIHEPWHAFLAATIAGLGNAGFWPSQSALLAGLTPPARRHGAYALQRVSRNLGIGLGGVVGGLIATTANPTSFTVLFLLDAATFLVFVAALAFVPEPVLPEEDGDGTRAGRYADVLRDRALVGLVVLNVLFVAAGYAQLELLPVFAKNEAGVTETGIGLIFLANTLVIVLAQFPLSKALEGRRRMASLAVMCALWAAAWIIVFAGRPPAGDRGGCSRLRAGGDPLRAGGVLPGPGAGRARGRPRSPAPPRPLHGGVDHLVGHRLHRRPRSRRVRPPG